VVDLLIVGAGITGCVIAEQAALKGLTSLIVEKRNHIGGNCYDEYHTSGVLIHKYGPHLFRTHKKEIVDYLSKYTDWIDGDYRVEAYVEGSYLPVPINRITLERFFGKSLSYDNNRRSN
jgi:UDP-galactopyranose mutase